MPPYGSNLMCTAPIQCIWSQYNGIHLSYDNPKLPYGAHGYSLTPDDSHVVYVVHRYSAWCQMAPKRLPYGSSGCIRAPSTSHVAPNGSHMGNMARIWLIFGSRLPYGSHTVHEGLPYSACGSHGAYVAPIQCLQCPHGAQYSHMVQMSPVMCTWLSQSCGPIRLIRLPYDTIHLPHGAPQRSFAT
jgi:hypothetical protein